VCTSSIFFPLPRARASLSIKNRGKALWHRDCCLYPHKGQVMERKIPQSRSEKWEKILAGTYIPMFGGRPRRGAAISKDDLLNLAILLNTTRNVDDFLKKI